MDEATSRRVKLLRFPLILLVLYIHSFIAPVAYRGSTVAVTPAPWLLVLQTAWSNGIARTAVPLFFLMSGYLYFAGFDGSLAAWRSKTARRISTLLVPYLFWNVLALALFALGQALPATAVYFNSGNERIADATPFAVADMVLGITRYPAAYQFWFIRDLMLITLVAPLVHWLLARGGVALPIVLLAAWVPGVAILPMPSIEALAWFVTGGWLAMGEVRLFPPVAWLEWLVPLYLALLACDVALRVADPSATWLYTVTVAAGVVAMLALTTLAERRPRSSAALISLSGASFFVFAAHEPLMTLLRKLLYRMLPPSQGLIFIGYAVLPLLLASMLTLLYFALRRVLPRFTATISGGR